ncbi:MAG: hypothetical protein H7Y13_11640 [Sphingobacteriaceae bacterium]|nr:hypothetical protein [Sphingobacteriaceae bacterium]
MKCYLFFLYFFLFYFSLSAQNSESSDGDTAKATVTLGTEYSSNVSYYGQASADRLPYILGSAQVVFPKGLWLSGYTYKLFDSQSGVSAINLTAGFSFDLTKALSGQLSYGKSFYPDNSPLLQSVNEDMVSTSLVYDWQWLSTGVTASYVPGKDDVLYTSFNASKVIDLGLSFSSKDYLTLEPVFEIVGGTQRFSDSVTTPAPPKAKQSPNIPIIGKPLNVPPVAKGQRFKKDGQDKGVITDVIKGKREDQVTVVTTTSYNIVSYNFTLPLVYNRTNYSIEASYQGAVLSKSVSTSQKLQSFFNLGFYYTF